MQMGRICVVACIVAFFHMQPAQLLAETQPPAGRTPVVVASTYSEPARGTYDLSRFNLSQSSLAAQIISIFENNTPVLQYDFADVLGDGRGLTAGRAGFTTGTQDLLLVVERYRELSPVNDLAKYIPRLRVLARQWSGSTGGLRGLEKAWQVAAADPKFRQAQDDVVDSLYLNKAKRYAKRLGISTPLGLLILTDSIIQHGFGSDPDGLPALIKRTSRKVGGTPARTVSEYTWLSEFLMCRRLTLESASNYASRKVWAESTGRIDTLEQLLESGLWGLDQEVVVNPWGTVFSLSPD